MLSKDELNSAMNRLCPSVAITPSSWTVVCVTLSLLRTHSTLVPQHDQTFVRSLESFALSRMFFRHAYVRATYVKRSVSTKIASFVVCWTHASVKARPDLAVTSASAVENNLQNREVARTNARDQHV